MTEPLCFEIISKLLRYQCWTVVTEQMCFIFHWNILYACCFTGQLNDITKSLGVHTWLELPGQYPSAEVIKHADEIPPALTYNRYTTMSPEHCFYTGE